MSDVEDTLRIANGATRAVREAEVATKEMIAEAEERWREWLRTGEGLELDEVREWLERRASGERLPPPRPRKIRPDTEQ